MVHGLLKTNAETNVDIKLRREIYDALLRAAVINAISPKY